MNYTIQNQFLNVEICSLGAEIQSIKGKNSQIEYLWQGNPEYWKSRSTVLFPVCGRMYEGKYTVDGKTYEMIIHGFAKLSNFDVANSTQDSIIFVLKSNEDTKKIYPFDFVFKMKYELINSSIRITYIVENPSDNSLPFSIGGHPGFNVPMVNGLNFEDYYLEFSQETNAKMYGFSPTCFLTGELVDYKMKDGKIIPLKHDLFDDDAIFLTNIAKSITLKSDKDKHYIRLEFEDMQNIGLWHKPHTNAPYICIEPWTGMPAHDGIIDDFNTKDQMTHLPAGKTYEAKYTIEVGE